jgi:DNA-binding transcriptional LysR family regulator
MELKQLRFFLAVADTLNFTRAAERVGIAQPPLSQRIRALERELGAELFKRTKRSVELTKAGEALLLHARRMMNASDTAVSQVRSVRDGKLGVLKVGAIFSAIYNWMPATLRILSTTSPGIDVNLREMTIPNQLRALREGEIDVGLLRPPVGDRSLVAELLHRERFVAAVPTSHPVALQSVVERDDFIANPFVGISPSFSRNYSIVAASAFASVRDDLKVTHETLDMHTLLAYVAAGRGLALVPESFTFLTTPDVAFRPIGFDAPSIPISLAWRRDSHTPILAEFAAAARQAVRDAQGRRISPPPNA